METQARRNIHLDPEKIVATIEALNQRVEERFPGSGLGRVVRDLLAVARDSAARMTWIRKPHLPIRITAGVLLVAMPALLAAIILSFDHYRIHEFGAFVEVFGEGLKSLVFLWAAILFLLSWEGRVKRGRALRALHELRALAHTVDMHQLTKDPERTLRPGIDTPSSPKRKMSAFELNRYLDYCSETLALISKLAAVYAQSLDDPIVLDAVDDVENLAATLSRTIWQKITILDRMTEVTPGTKSDGVPRGSRFDPPWEPTPVPRT